MSLEDSFSWQAPSSDSNDEQFGGIVDATALDNAEEYDAVLVGEPYDGAVIGRPGTREGPGEIRESLQTLKTHHFDAGPVTAVGDLGDVEIPTGESVSTVQEQIRETAAAVHDTDTLPVFLGGDNSLTYANVAPLLKAEKATDGGYLTDGGFGDDEKPVGDVEHFDPAGGDESSEDETEEEADTDEAEVESDVDETEVEADTDETAEDSEESEPEAEETEEESDRRGVGVISLDAHLDCREVEGQPTSGSPYRQLFEAGLDALAVVGARHFETSTAYAEFLREQDGEIVTAEEVGADPVEATDRALDVMDGVETIYLSVDMDVLDVTAAPGVSAPTPGGITTRELFRVVRMLASEDRLAGVEVVETAPSLCPDGRTADAASRVVAHALSVAGGTHG